MPTAPASTPRLPARPPRVAGGDTRYSVVDDVVFGRDLDGSSEVEGQVSRAMAGGSAAFGGKGGKGAYAPSRASLVGEVGLRWDPDDPSYHRGNAAMLAPIDGGKRTEQYVSPLALPPSPERKESPQGRHSPGPSTATTRGRAKRRPTPPAARPGGTCRCSGRGSTLHADAAHLNGARALPGHPADYHPANDERGGVVVGHRRSLAPRSSPAHSTLTPPPPPLPPPPPPPPPPPRRRRPASPLSAGPAPSGEAPRSGTAAHPLRMRVAPDADARP